MRVTKEQRFLRGIHDVRVGDWAKRCNKCDDDVRREPMFRKKVFSCGPGGGHTMWHYLCTTCAPSLHDAANHWRPKVITLGPSDSDIVWIDGETGKVWTKRDVDEMQAHFRALEDD